VSALLVQPSHDARWRFEAVDVVDRGIDTGVDLALQLPLPRLGGWSWMPAGKCRVAEQQDQARGEGGGSCSTKGQELSIGSALGGFDFVASGE
jgi:hypothetical protein